MADVKICDRCKKILTDKRAHISRKPEKHQFRIEIFKWRDSYRTSCTDHDLCEDCTQKLVNFLEGKSVDALV